MRRSWLIWLVFGASATAMLGAMGWAIHTVLRLYEAEAKARREAALEENVRLSLWRLDSALGSLIVTESARPYFTYWSFYPAGGGALGPGGRPSPSRGMAPSPLLSEQTPWVKLHFQIGPDGTATSPRAPGPEQAKLAAAQRLSAEEVARTTALLDAFQNRVAVDRVRREVREKWLLEEVSGSSPGEAKRPDDRSTRTASPRKRPAETPAGATPARSATAAPNAPPSQAVATQNRPEPAAKAAEAPPAPQQQEAPPPNAQAVQTASPAEIPVAPIQQQRNIQEWMARENFGLANNIVLDGVNVQTEGSADYRWQGRSKRKPAEKGREVKVGMLQPVWAGGELLLARQVRLDGAAYLQGCWLDWPKVRPWLLGQVRDLLPEADLVPQTGSFNPAEGRTLASLPVRIVPGRLALGLPDDGSPLRFSLKLAGLGVLAAILAVGLLLLGALTLSRRRAAFVSSVTHELRTPLTTFRMYTEMLVDGMATDPEKLRDYHATLQTEADRLSHLVENVLAYARLERGRYGVVEEVALTELLGRIMPRLEEHAGRAGMELVRDDGGENGTRVKADVSAVERILFNLVDNAAKYAREADDKRIHLSAGRAGRWVRLEVLDHGPGVGSVRRGRLFSRPFRKSAQEAARSAPGVGIGLALSRRLAKAMGGRLRLLASSPAGTTFRLELPAAAT